MDVRCGCGGIRMPTCKGTGGSILVRHGAPSVLEAAGVDSERYTGWAFGMGPVRMAVSRYGIPDVRTLYDSDVRFLEQIAR
jgi:phenylalanyl-tRNA synthetase alpha chain